MQRVSTAFVGQVSAASSPAVAKLKGRARATNDSAYMPLASSHRAQSRGVATLASIFLDALGGRAAVSELQLVQVRKAAELTTAAEAVRARVLAGDGPWAARQDRGRSKAPRRNPAIEDVCSPGKAKKYKRGQPKTLVDINFFTARIIMSNG
jgi:hypothetical protein